MQHYCLQIHEYHLKKMGEEYFGWRKKYPIWIFINVDQSYGKKSEILCCLPSRLLRLPMVFPNLTPVQGSGMEMNRCLLTANMIKLSNMNAMMKL